MRRKQVKYDLTEVDVGRAIKEANLFKNMEYAEEVGIGSSGSCDLVYFNDGEVYAIELKKQVNIKVMAQATRWLETASRVYVACPCTLSQDARQVLRTMGIGYIMVSEFQGILDDKPQLHARIALQAEPLPETWISGFRNSSIWTKSLKPVRRPAPDRHHFLVSLPVRRNTSPSIQRPR